MIIKTRFAPSPTGNLHFGNIRTALYSWLYAKKNNGIFVLRIEDTDKKRSKSIFTKNIFHTLKWLKLNWNEGPFFQSKKIKYYQEIILYMLKKGFAYKCYCDNDTLLTMKKKKIFEKEKPRYDGRCRNLGNNFNSLNKYVIRFKNPINGTVSFNDIIRGKIQFNNSELDDLIIQRENGIPTYNFCVVIDDIDSKITHIIRGEDHINNTPRQINILKVLQAKIPSYAHLSMVMNSDKKNFSKRDNSTKILTYKKLGYLPEAILNYILRLGWSHGNKEIFSIPEMIQLFNLKSITKSSSIFDLNKLLWINKYYMNLSHKKYIKKMILYYFKKNNLNDTLGLDLDKLIKNFLPHSYTIQNLFDLISHFYIKDNKIIYPDDINNYLNFNTLNILEIVYNKILVLKDWNLNIILNIIKNISLSLSISLKDIIIPIRLALIGKIHSIGINQIIYFLGKEKSLFRIKNFIKYIKVSLS
ncbi:glutamate--tRNA ligase [Buchnera aphidicola]|uniref:glutamate--tRNA ligase n=1 Tax=Buchnera aphidicola TaxID=9 RepID=UPI00223794C3|nr:glutamate--tRNA ligase [Buchnera aphidicola]MCW5197373.1 glutamate--tRNA ligase [Buchnera aphidicola (Chaitophorus viminalis)]